MKSLPHVGCGPKRIDRTTAGCRSEDWREIRQDIDPSVNPVVTGTMTDMSTLRSAGFAVVATLALAHFPA